MTPFGLIVNTLLSNVVDVVDVLIFIVKELYGLSYDLPLLPLPFPLANPSEFNLKVKKDPNKKLYNYHKKKYHQQTHRY